MNVGRFRSTRHQHSLAIKIALIRTYVFTLQSSTDKMHTNEDGYVTFNRTFYTYNYPSLVKLSQCG